VVPGATSGPADGGFNEQGEFVTPSRLLLGSTQTNSGDFADPIDIAPGVESVSFGPTNKFAQGLSDAIGVGPGAVLLWPVTNPSDQALALVLGGALRLRSGRLTVYPDDLSPGWVPCAGQTYTYLSTDGVRSEFTVPSICAGSPEFYNSVYYKAVYVMKIPPNPTNEPLRRNFLINLAPVPQVFSVDFL
jgi:hypothetical protein